MQEATADRIQDYMQSVYDANVRSFFQSRIRMRWEILEQWAQGVQSGDTVADIGCGIGRIVSLLPAGIRYCGVDISERQLAWARDTWGEEKGVREWKQGSMGSIPVSDEWAQHVFAVAVMHHVPSPRFRARAMGELARIAAAGGRIYITVWNLWSRRHRKRIWEQVLRKAGMRRPRTWLEYTLAREGAWNDCIVPWKGERGVYLERYHHAFWAGELSRLARKTGLRVVWKGKERGNIAIVAEKLC